ncbi:MAG: hypothetical protein CMM73_03435 [Rhodospirillaceae bacterium]|nr:hypothetical protein [Rhodospirillaceae bacterium]
MIIMLNTRKMGHIFFNLKSHYLFKLYIIKQILKINISRQKGQLGAALRWWRRLASKLLANIKII